MKWEWCQTDNKCLGLVKPEKNMRCPVCKKRFQTFGRVMEDGLSKDLFFYYFPKHKKKSK